MQPIGHVDSLTIFGLSGWAADLSQLAQSVDVLIEVDGREVGRVSASAHRPGLDAIAPGATGYYCFEFAFPEPLSPFRDHAVHVRVVGAEATELPGLVNVAALRRQAPPTSPSLAPLLVMTMDRLGAAHLMGLLASNPGIVVAGQAPFEWRLLTYYAQALRHLTAPADHVRSLHPDRVTTADGALQLGRNPYFDPSFRHGLKEPAQLDALMTTTAPNAVADAFRSIAETFYTELAIDLGQPRAIYFAEKAPTQPLIHAAAKFMFGSAAMIVIVRDLRDVLCTFMDERGGDFDNALELTMAVAEATCRMLDAGEADIHVVRYEQLANAPDAALATLSASLGLPAIPDAAHAATHDLAASVGRWRKELDATLLQRCVGLDPFQLRLGYDPTTTETSSAEPPLSLRDLMLQFESLGENCEFGLVQRQCGAEPLGLLRFSSSPLPKLIKALRGRFAGMGQNGNFRVEPSENGREYMVHDDVFGLTYHAWVKVGEMEPQAIYDREARRIPFLVRKLIDDLSGGEKTFVFHGMTPLTHSEATALANAVRNYGSSRVLWVEQAAPGSPPGTVRPVGVGLLKGFVDRFAPGDNAHDLSLDSWVSLCRSANAIAPDHRP